MITRRNFIQALGMATIVGAAFNLSGTVYGQTTESNHLFPIPVESLTDPVLSFTSAHFLPFTYTDFEIRQENMRRAETLRLLEVKDIVHKTNVAEGIKGDSFSLMFFSPRRAKLKAGQYEFTHFSLGTFTLAITPVSADPNRFEAVINHQQR
jgi:hypothetical protein